MSTQPGATQFTRMLSLARSNAIVRVSRDGTVADVASNGADGPLQFPASPSFSGNALYASNFDIERGANAPNTGGVGASLARIDVGVMELNELPANYFADVEQAAFNPAHIVPGHTAAVLPVSDIHSLVRHGASSRRGARPKRHARVHSCQAPRCGPRANAGIRPPVSAYSAIAVPSRSLPP